MPDFFDPSSGKTFTSGRDVGILGLTPDNCADHGIVTYSKAPRPSVTSFQEAELDAVPALINGEWVKSWTVTDKALTEVEKRALISPISHVQFASALAIAGVITEQEASDYVGGNALPQMVLDVIDGHPTLLATEKMLAKLKIKGTTVITRDSAYIAMLAAAPSINLNDTELDNLFTMAAAL